jgi:hypothetical protein
MGYVRDDLCAFLLSCKSQSAKHWLQMNMFVTKVVYEPIRTFYTLQHCRYSVAVFFYFVDEL